MSLKSGFSTLWLPLEGPRVTGQLPHQTDALPWREVRHILAAAVLLPVYDPYPNIFSVTHPDASGGIWFAHTS